MTGTKSLPAVATNSATTSQYVQVPPGFTLVGVEIPIEATSTTFTLVHCQSSGGTYTTLKDPLGIYTAAAGDPVTLTLGATSLGTFLIPPIVSASLYSFIKVILGSNETAAVNLIFKQLA